jgi:hypothetical protein
VARYVGIAQAIFATYQKFFISGQTNHAKPKSVSF